MLLNLIFVSQALALPNLSSKLKNAVGNVVPNQAKQEYNSNCKPSIDSINDLEATVGTVSKENLRSYEQARLNLNIAIESCANIDTSGNSDLQSLQKELLHHQ